MNRPYTTEITMKLSRPVANPIGFWGPAEADIDALDATLSPWRQAGSRMCDAFFIHSNLNAASQQARGQAGEWLQYSANAVATAVLRCAVPPAAAYLAYQRASVRGDNVGNRCWLPMVGLASGFLTSAVGIAVNAVQIVGGAAMAGMCLGLSGYFFVQAALNTWRPPVFVARL